MSTELKFKITTLSVLLGFCVQLISVAWLLSSIVTRIDHNAEILLSVKKEQQARTSNVYKVQMMEREISMMTSQIIELKRELKALHGRRYGTN